MSTLVDSYGSTTTSLLDTTRDIRSATAWGPVFAGVVAAIASQLLFTVLGIALGVTAGAIDSNGYPAASTVGMIAGLWWLLSGTVSLAIGGAVLGTLWNRSSHCNLTLHAAALWSTVAVFGFLVIVSGAGIASSAASPMAMVMGRSGNDLTIRGDLPNLRDNSAEAVRERTLLAEQARVGTQTASWWAVFGMIAGLAVTIAAATAARRADLTKVSGTAAVRTGYPATTTSI